LDNLCDLGITAFLLLGSWPPLLPLSFGAHLVMNCLVRALRMRESLIMALLIDTLLEALGQFFDRPTLGQVMGT
jgi:hypothetical protein